MALFKIKNNLNLKGRALTIIGMIIAIIPILLIYSGISLFGCYTKCGFGGHAIMYDSSFYLNAWRVDTNGIKLEIKYPIKYKSLNTSQHENLTIRNVEISNCGSNNSQRFVSKGNHTTVTIPCSLKEGDRINEQIIITYREPGSTEDLVTKGNITNELVSSVNDSLVF